MGIIPVLQISRKYSEKVDYKITEHPPDMYQ